MRERKDILVIERDVFGFIRPAVDAHTLGLAQVAQLIESCGYRVVLGDSTVSEAVNHLERSDSVVVLRRWLEAHQVTRLGLSFRLDARAAQLLFGKLVHVLKEFDWLRTSPGNTNALYFAGLPAACDLIESEYLGRYPVFRGDENATETLERLGVPRRKIPPSIERLSAYDDALLSFGRAVVDSGRHFALKPPDRSGYATFGTRRDSVIDRLAHGLRHDHPPLVRAHIGPYHPDRMNALREFEHWLTSLAASGWLDIASIGTSQLTQERFGEDWGDEPNGGGVPINSPEEYLRISAAARPMLIRTYAGTRNIPALARMHEETLNIAWHALSFWWFSQIDGRGPNSVRTNLDEHMETLRFIARTGKPFEPNIPHHFGFRGADDLTYVLSGYLAARTARAHGVPWLILQNMLNTPRQTAGVQDLAKARALLRLVRELETPRFRIIYQPRAGLDFFSPDVDKAKAQLAAVTALMDDVEPANEKSPQIIHVVSYSEGSHLATPPIVDDSIRIVHEALRAYRQARRGGEWIGEAVHEEAERRATHLISEVRILVNCIEAAIPEPYTAEGLYRTFEAGFLATPQLWACRDEFSRAVAWNTAQIDGGFAVVGESGKPLSASERGMMAAEWARSAHYTTQSR